MTHVRPVHDLNYMKLQASGAYAYTEYAWKTGKLATHCRVWQDSQAARPCTTNHLYELMVTQQIVAHYMRCDMGCKPGGCSAFVFTGSSLLTRISSPQCEPLPSSISSQIWCKDVLMQQIEALQDARH